MFNRRGGLTAGCCCGQAPDRALPSSAWAATRAIGVLPEKVARLAVAALPLVVVFAVVGVLVLAGLTWLVYWAAGHLAVGD